MEIVNFKTGTAINGDCMEILESGLIKEKSVSLLLNDPPYGTTPIFWDKKLNFVKIWELMDSLFCDQAVSCIFGSEPFSTEIRTSNLENYKYDWIWVKNIGTGVGHAKNKPLKSHEKISVFSKNKLNHESISGKNRMPYNPQGLKKLEIPIKGRKLPSKMWSLRQKGGYRQEYANYPKDVLYFDKDVSGAGFHETQKPVDLLSYLIKTYTKENDLVLDITGGSLSVAIACIYTGRRFLVIEKEKEYFEKGVSWINETYESAPLFGSYYENLTGGESEKD